MSKTGTKDSGKVPIDCSTCAARPDGLCGGCAPEVVQTISGYKSGDLVVKAGEDLFSQGEPCETLYNLVDGWVFLYNLLEDGRRQILHFAIPGAMLGFHPARGALATYGAQALTDATVCMIPHKNLDPLAQDHPEMGMRLAWQIARDRGLAYDHMASIGRQSARERVAHLLLELYIRYRTRWPGHDIEEMAMPLTQEHIGDATGLTGVHVNRVLNQLKDEGVLGFQYRKLRILDPDTLVDIAGIDPQVVYSWAPGPLPR